MRSIPLFFLFCSTMLAATPVDFEGPDGLKISNVTFAGVPGEIPDLAVVAKIEDFGGKPEADISEALEKAALAAAAKGGGAVLIGPGTFYLDRPVLISSSGVVLRGAGMEQTKLIFRWEPKKDSVDFIGIEDGDTIPPQKTNFDAAWNDSRDNKVVKCIKRLALEINGQPAAEQTGGEGPWFCISPDNRKSAQMLGTGENTLRATVDYIDGRSASKEIKVTVSDDPALLGASPRDSAIHFAEPTGLTQIDWANQSTSSVVRGEDTIALSGPVAWEAGDVVLVGIDNGGWGDSPILEIAENNGTELKFKQPFRFDFPVKNVRRIAMLRGSGIEDLTMEQTSGHWTNFLTFTRDFGCWARRVRLIKAGRFPVSGMVKHFELRDSEVLGAQFHFGVGGGTGYLAFSASHDGLMENIKTEKLRHAPTFQHGSQGCVIRASHFEDSDAQFHRGHTWDNLLENSTVHSRGGNKSYGSYGPAVVVTTDPHTSDVGSGNMIYNNTFTSENLYKGGTAFLLKCGPATNWLVAYNTFESDKGSAIKCDGTGHGLLFLNNTFTVAEPEAPAVTGNISSLRLRENTFIGFTESEIFPDGSKPAENTGTKTSNPKGVTPKVPSLFEWQKTFVKSLVPAS